MEDTELYMLTSVLDNLSRVEDVRNFIGSFVFEDKVLFNKAAQIFQGGKMGERSKSQKPNYRTIKPNAKDPSEDLSLDQQSGDLNEDPEETNNDEANIQKIVTEEKGPVLSYFKSFNESTTRSRTSNIGNQQKRNASQKSRLPVDENKLHFMPIVEKKPLAIDTVKNGWVSKFDKDPTPTKIEGVTQYLSDGKRNSSTRAQMVVSKSELVFKRNDVKTSSIGRKYRKNSRAQKTPTRYANFNHTPSHSLKTSALANNSPYPKSPNSKVGELVLIGTNKSSSGVRLSPTFKGNSSPSRNKHKLVHSRSGKPLEVNTFRQSNGTSYKLSKILSEISAGNKAVESRQRNYLSNFTGGIDSQALKSSISSNLTNSNSLFRFNNPDSNQNHRQLQVLNYTSSPGLKLERFRSKKKLEYLSQPPESGLFIKNSKN